ncbi:MAG: radical SAM protein [Methanomassiliicoccales archaeon]|nr:radical SAM protein [Methanomassiliicoccales archaeon]
MKEPLARYHSILDGRSKAYYLLAKDMHTDFSPSLTDEELWKLHADQIAAFHSHVDVEEFKRGSKEGLSAPATSLLDLKLELAKRMLSRCEICEWRCQVNRNKGVKGRCGVLDPRIASEFLHYGEEPPLIPSYTIFFSGCNFKCVFCQNYDISTHPDEGICVPPQRLAAKIADRFGGRACSKVISAMRVWTPTSAVNVNWVGGDPTPNLHYVLDVLKYSVVNIPQIWNSNMFLTEKSMELLDGIIDVYLTDFKYGNNSCAKRLSGVQNYFEIVSRNHLLAAKQAEVIVRHLVLPNHIECCTKPVLKWIAENIPSALVNVMDQYRPVHRAFEHRDINRPLKPSEFQEAYDLAQELNLHLV